MTRSTPFTHSLATFGYVGTMRPGPGTWGSLAALPVGWAIHVLGGPLAFLLATIAVFFAGLWATECETAGQADHDPSEIVIDEVAGQWTALLPVSFGAWVMGAEVLRLWPGIVAAFLLFRLFDIWKPGPVGWADRMHTPLGVMLDDVIAGALAAVGVMIMAALAHGVLM
jgi:phosphatidylglycerophosphatase A